ncbi:chaplin [Streptomyces sp. SudanB182_2057]|uniref:chaplin n=1 Tax=Streptomyces sp. SudanB182_2057 TaxID=3035281 RepID=UPI003F5496B7
MGMARRVRAMRKRAVLVGSTLGAASVAVSAAPAQANIIGVGNAAFGNTCANHGDAQASGATVSGSGVLSGNALQLPLDLPRNECGNSGMTCLTPGQNMAKSFIPGFSDRALKTAVTPVVWER